MGKLFDNDDLKLPAGLPNFLIVEFDQTESAISGRAEEDESDDDDEDQDLEIHPWMPSEL